MQKRAVTTFLLSGALIVLTLPNAAWAVSDLTPATDAPKVQLTVRDGKLCATNAAPNAPVELAAAPVARLDSRMPAPIQDMVHRISKTHGVDPLLVAAVMKVESNYNQWAQSSKGALGLMQLIPATGERFGVHNFFDPAQNIEGGVRYLRFLSDKFGSSRIDLITAAYNAGENLVQRLGGRVPQIAETQAYVSKIRTIYHPSSTPAAARVSPSVDPKPVVDTAEAEPGPAKIYQTVDERGVRHFSNIGPPR